MSFAILDTNILVHYLRKSSLSETIQTYLNTQNLIPFISVVSKAELMAIAKMNHWGDEKLRDLNGILANLNYLDIEYNNSELLNSYAIIQAFSQGKIPAPDGKTLNKSARNMGKNDLWIAATTYALNAVLITNDNDFDHLNNAFFTVKKFQTTFLF
ncbi:MAG: PIN domain-containing protein [Flammeovirgaceae bacterium]